MLRNHEPAPGVPRPGSGPPGKEGWQQTAASPATVQ